MKITHNRNSINMQIGCMQTTAKFNKVFGRKIIVLLACVIIGHEKTFVFIIQMFYSFFCC